MNGVICENFRKRGKIFLDLFLSLLATALPLLFLQLVILPKVAGTIGAEPYGLLLTLVSMITLVSQPLGSALNNARLLMQDLYRDDEEKGDFPPLLYGSIALSTLVVLLASTFYLRDGMAWRLPLILLIAASGIAVAYFIVEFRIHLDYLSYLVNSLFMIAGYSLGYLLLRKTGLWEWVYLLANLFSLIHLFRHSTLHREPLRKTVHFREALQKCLEIAIATFLMSCVTYSDKLMLFPLLGSTSVAVYYASDLLGKVVGLAISPISGVLLSYLSRMERVRGKLFRLLLLILLLLLLLAYPLVLLVNRPILGLLYPSLAERAMEIVPITTVTALMTAAIGIINPLLLRFYKTIWQVCLSAVILILHLVLALLFFYLWGLKGFCYGILLARLFRLILSLLLLYRGRHRVFAN